VKEGIQSPQPKRSTFLVTGGELAHGLNPKLNNENKAAFVRVIGANGEQLGILPLAEGLELARASGMDLVEIAPNANPPVARITKMEKYRKPALGEGREDAIQTRTE
jgi:translation initiation factor IF-3